MGGEAMINSLIAFSRFVVETGIKSSSPARSRLTPVRSIGKNMNFTVTPKKVKSGEFATLSSEGRPLAQVFVPARPAVAEQFSFFWFAPATRGHIHELLGRILRAESEVKVRLIGRSYVTTFGFSRTWTPDQHPEAWNFRSVHELIEKADLPYSLGLTVDSSMLRDWVSEVYVWASVAADVESGPVQGQPEVGIQTTLRDWHNPAFEEAIFPLFESTIRLGEVTRDLWSQAAETARSLVTVESLTV
jgi:hypothetical protein